MAVPSDTPGPDAAKAQEPRFTLRRRHLLFGGAAASVGAAAAVGAQIASSTKEAATAAPSADTGDNGSGVVPFHGARQAGVTTAAQAHGNFIGLDLDAEISKDRLKALLRLLSDDAANLTQGKAALADTEGELALRPANLTVTFGFGPRVVNMVAPAKAPGWLKELPAFSIDRLIPELGDGDLLLQICADDPLTVAHAQRMLLKDSRSFAKVRWVQSGFRRAYGTEQSGMTMRNLFGQLDGTTNPVMGSQDMERIVWGHGGVTPWTENGTSVVIRRISMNLDKWDKLDRSGREESVGRTLKSGAPLTGLHEHDEPDFAALNPVGFPVIADFAHMRRARPDDTAQRLHRRAYNYDVAPGPGSVSDSGLIFVSYQADVDQQFVPIQKRLDELDLLNEWTTPIGSAVFAVPPGCPAGGFIGQDLFS